MRSEHLDGKVVLVTGGTGSFGQKFVETVLARFSPNRLIIFSRDELKQYEMQQRLSPSKHPSLRFFIGDVRDRNRLYRAFDGVDVVIHTAALKQVPACEYNPFEAIQTNVLGAANIVDAAIDRGVKKVIALSTDKAANPVNLYGATKLCSDKVFVAANHYAGVHDTRFSVVRYGNVMGSRGSVIPFFLMQREQGVLSITDPRMTRFWITLQQGVDFVLENLERMVGGEIFVPRIPSMNIMDLAAAIAPDCKTEVIGIRPGEKLHEVMVTEDDARQTVAYPDYYAIVPSYHKWSSEDLYLGNGGKRCEDGFRYSSDLNDRWLSVSALRETLGLEGVTI
jgi:UDP-N-acetylglucosamine 4,6-dehydratase